MSSPTTTTPKERLEVLFEELSELAGQRNAIDGRIVEIVAEIDRDGLCGMTGANVVTTENSDWATNCPEYKVTAVQVELAHPAVREQEADALDGVLAAELVD